MVKIEGGVGSVPRIECGGSRWSPVVVLCAFSARAKAGRESEMGAAGVAQLAHIQMSKTRERKWGEWGVGAPAVAIRALR